MATATERTARLDVRRKHFPCPGDGVAWHRRAATPSPWGLGDRNILGDGA